MEIWFYLSVDTFCILIFVHMHRSYTGSKKLTFCYYSHQMWWESQCPSSIYWEIIHTLHFAPKRYVLYVRSLLMVGKLIGTSLLSAFLIRELFTLHSNFVIVRLCQFLPSHVFVSHTCSTIICKACIIDYEINTLLCSVQQSCKNGIIISTSHLLYEFQVSEHISCMDS